MRGNVVREIEGKYDEAVIGSLKPGPEQLSRSDGETRESSDGSDISPPPPPSPSTSGVSVTTSELLQNYL